MNASNSRHDINKLMKFQKYMWAILAIGIDIGHDIFLWDMLID